MDLALVIGCGLLGLVVGGFVNLLIERVPKRLRLWPLRGPVTAIAKGPGAHGADADEVDAPLLEPEDRAPEESADRPPLEPAGRARASRVMVHVATALIFAATAVHFGATWVLPAYLVFFTALLAISVIDMEHHIIPNRIVYPTIFVSVPLLVVAAAAEGNWSRLRAALIGAVLAWLALFAIHLVSPGGMGFGDVRLSFILGLFLGWLGLIKVVIGLFLGFLLGSVIGLALIGLHLRTRKDHIPFGPFLAAGAALAVFFGGPIARWWLHSG